MAVDYDSPSDAIDVNSRSNHSDLPKESPPDRTQLAGDVVPLPISPGPIEALGKRTYDRELRRSPGDNTFRKTNEMNTDWDKFKAPLGGKK